MSECLDGRISLALLSVLAFRANSSTGTRTEESASERPNHLETHTALDCKRPPVTQGKGLQSMAPNTSVKAFPFGRSQLTVVTV